MICSSFAMTLLLVFTGPVEAAPPESVSPPISPIDVVGLVKVVDELDLPATREGRLSKVRIRRGDEVQKRALLAEIDNRDAKLRLEAARAERASAQLDADSDLRVRSSALGAAQADYELKLNIEVNAGVSETVPALEIRRLEAASEQASLETKLVQLQAKQAKNAFENRDQQWKLAQNDVADRDLLSPLDGLIVEVLAAEGEWVRQGDPVARIARMDILNVEAFFQTQVISPHNMLGRLMQVTFEFPDEEPVVLQDCKVNFVSHRVEADGSCRFSVEIANRRDLDQESQSRWLIRPGMKALISSQPVTVNAPSGL